MGAAGAALPPDVARLLAERASHASELGAMLGRLATCDKAREVAEQRATALDKWAEELEDKVVEARSRCDEQGDALEMDHSRRELEALASQHQAELAASRGPQGSAGIRAARDAMAKVIATLEELLEQHESQSALALRRAFDPARGFVALAAGVTPRLPSTKDVPTVRRPNHPPSARAACWHRPCRSRVRPSCVHRGRVSQPRRLWNRPRFRRLHRPCRFLRPPSRRQLHATCPARPASRTHLHRSTCSRSKGFSTSKTSTCPTSAPTRAAPPTKAFPRGSA